MSKTSVRYHQLTSEIAQVVTVIRRYPTFFGRVRYHQQTSDGIKPFLLGAYYSPCTRLGFEPAWSVRVILFHAFYEKSIVNLLGKRRWGLFEVAEMSISVLWRR